MLGILWLLLIGLIAGALARAIVPGPDPMAWWQTIVLGVIGSFVGGFIGSLLGDGDITDLNTSGILLSVVGAVVALLVYRMVRRRA
ncbi:MAG TPA: GlsB/YeaQ/YmgE family stress response membrane protein [Acidimicrobiia bacterium]|nr:GlsB/YeaQ/YmgE family stress response membrane protein [Acidimicrobiia bacterium]